MAFYFKKKLNSFIKNFTDNNFLAMSGFNPMVSSKLEIL